MEFQLPYYKGTLPLNVPDENLSHVLTNRAEEFKSSRSEADIVRDALAAALFGLASGLLSLLLL